MYSHITLIIYTLLLTMFHKDMYMSYNYVPCISTPTMSKDHIEFEATNQNKNQTNDFSEINQNPPHKDPCDETKKICEEED